MKKCPFCAEEIQDEAIVCRYCHKNLKKGMSFKDVLFSFKGRIGRKNYWLSSLFLTIIYFVYQYIMVYIDNVYQNMGSPNMNSFTAFFFLSVVFLFSIMTLWIQIAVYIKRTHDLDKSGWNTLFFLIPIINIFYGLEIAFSKGTEGPNRYGFSSDTITSKKDNNQGNTELIGEIKKRNSFVGADMSGFNLQGFDLRNTSLKNAKLIGANLKKANLKKVDVSGANLEGSCMESANLKDANLVGANIQDSSLVHVNLESADLKGANLKNADISFGNMKKTCAQGANLEGANLQNANLEDSDLRKANLERAKTTDSNFKNANLRGATMPDGIVYDPHIRSHRVFVYKTSKTIK